MLRLFQCISSSLSLFETAKWSPTLSLIRMTFLMALSFIFVFGSHLLLNFTLWCNTAAASKHCDISGDTTDMASFILKQLSLLHSKNFVSCLTERSLTEHQHFTLHLASRRKLLLVPFPWIIPNKLCAFVCKSSPILFSYSLSHSQIHPRLRYNFRWQALLQQALPWHYQSNVWLYIGFLPHRAEFVFQSIYSEFSYSNAMRMNPHLISCKSENQKTVPSGHRLFWRPIFFNKSISNPNPIRFYHSHQ